MHNQPLISVIIPCFNHGKYIDEALNSINKDAVKYDLEILIVDDGSTDEFTKQKLLSLTKNGYQILFGTNEGPAAARNKGVKHASGKYILPLDADNRITSAYINQAIPLLESDICDIVYCEPVFFNDNGVIKKKFNTKKFDRHDLLIQNTIDACAVFKKEVWLQNNGYDTALPYYGHEDWEFWIHALKNGFRFHFLKEKLFYYRVVEGSVSGQFSNNEKVLANHKYIITKHADLFIKSYKQLYYLKKRYQKDIKWNFLSGFSYLAYLTGILTSPFNKVNKKIS